MRYLTVLCTLAAMLALSAATAQAAGVLRVACDYDHRGQFDPIVFPGLEPAGHLHNFFGNTSTNKDSTPATLRANTDTSCRLAADTAAYWFPEAIRGGQPWQLRQAVVYYSSKPGKGYVHTMPANAEMIGGDKESADYPGVKRLKFDCLAHAEAPERARPYSCVPFGNSEAQITVRFPNCWDGTPNPGPSNFVYGPRANECPAGYTAIPHLRISFETNLHDASALTLSSGPLYTAHADFMNGWDQAELNSRLRAAGVIQ